MPQYTDSTQSVALSVSVKQHMGIERARQREEELAASVRRLTDHQIVVCDLSGRALNPTGEITGIIGY